MALQGNIETFALPDVLRLLSSTNKTGRLRLEGPRGEGRLWVVEGKLVSGSSTTTGDAAPTDVLFEMLRFSDGDFVFDQDETTDEGGAEVEVEAALTEAEGMLDEWRELESVVPSLDAWLTLSAALPGDDLTLTKDLWASIVAVGGGRSVASLGQHHELGELGVLRLVRDLIGLGVVEVGEAPAAAEVAPEDPISFADRAPLVDAAPATVPEPEAVPEAEPEVSFEPVDAGDGLPPLMGLDDGAAVDDGLPPLEDLPGLSVVPDVETSAEPLDDLPAFDTGGLLADEQPAEPEEPADAAEIAKQLASLSPKAAKAVAAAAKATTEEERDEALSALEDEDTSLNRDLLLKFLGSVNS